MARSTNVYKIWADMIAFGGTDMPVGEHYYCPFAGRRDGKNFVYSHEQIMQKYQQNMKMVDRIPDALSGAMGNQMYVATFSTREELSLIHIFSKIVPIKMAYLRYAVCGCCLGIRNANCYSCLLYTSTLWGIGYKFNDQL